MKYKFEFEIEKKIKNCQECEFGFWYDGPLCMFKDELTYDDYANAKRPDDCPLQEVEE